MSVSLPAPQARHGRPEIFNTDQGSQFTSFNFTGALKDPEPKSFNAHLATIAQETLAERGWAVSSSDLYAMAFDPCEKATHYEDHLREIGQQDRAPNVGDL